jgi:hypothetical protein
MNVIRRSTAVTSRTARRGLAQGPVARVLVGLALVAGAALVAAASAQDTPANPLPRYALNEPLVLEGRVAERLRAGPYLYLRLERPAAEPVWVATMARLASTEDEVRVTAVARADAFPSTRLGRTFSPLLFGAVRAVSSTHTQEKP